MGLKIGGLEEVPLPRSCSSETHFGYACGRTTGRICFKDMVSRVDQGDAFLAHSKMSGVNGI